ncbi:MAG TPA: hypothetical protein VGF29_13615 [Hyphomicrobiaceae bacterium]|jgi:hypothetical protein
MNDSSPQTGPPADTGARVRAAAGGALRALHLAGAAVLAFWRLARPGLRWTLQVLLALLILLEQWGWEPLADLLGRLARWQPWAQAETAVARLPPYAALVAFALPTTLLLPLKFLALFLIARGHLVLAGLLFAAAKVVATALVARLFMLTQPALMQIAWFAWAYDRFMPWKNALEDYVRSSYVWRVARMWKERARRAAAAQWRLLRPVVLRLGDAAGLAAAWAVEQARRLGREIKARWAELQR